MGPPVHPKGAKRRRKAAMEVGRLLRRPRFNPRKIEVRPCPPTRMEASRPVTSRDASRTGAVKKRRPRPLDHRGLPGLRRLASSLCCRPKRRFEPSNPPRWCMNYISSFRASSTSIGRAGRIPERRRQDDAQYPGGPRPQEPAAKRGGGAAPVIAETQFDDSALNVDVLSMKRSIASPAISPPGARGGVAFLRRPFRGGNLPRCLARLA